MDLSLGEYVRGVFPMFPLFFMPCPCGLLVVENKAVCVCARTENKMMLFPDVFVLLVFLMLLLVLVFQLLKVPYF